MPEIALNLKLEGFAEFSRALRRLPNEVSGQILQTALGAGAAIIRAEAALRAPRDAARRRYNTVRLSDSIKIFAGERDAAHAVIDVGSKVRYAYLVEFGHQIVPRGPTRERFSITTVRVSKRTGKQVISKRFGLDPTGAIGQRRAAGTAAVSGFVAARPFLRPAMDENRERIVATIGRTLGRDIERALRRLLPKARAA